MITLAIKTNGRLSPELFRIPAAKDKLSFIEVTAAAFSNQAGKRGAMFVLQEVTLRVQSERQRTEAVVELRLIANALRTLHAISTEDSGCLNDKIRDFLRLGLRTIRASDRNVVQIEGDKIRVLESVSDNPKFAAGAVFDSIAAIAELLLDRPNPSRSNTPAGPPGEIAELS